MIKSPKLDEAGAISELHLKNLKDGILPSLGRGVLKIFYKEIIQDECSFVFAYYYKGEIVGVAALTCNYDGLLRKIKMRHFIRLFFAILLKFLDNPLTPFKILFSKYPPEPKAELMFLFVDEKLRGKGIGQRLVEATSKKFRELSVKKYKITILSENERGKKFYEKMGFEHAGRCDFLNKPRDIYVFNNSKAMAENTHGLKEFFLSLAEGLYNDAQIRQAIFNKEALKNYPSKKNKSVFMSILCLYLEEAELTIQLIKKVGASKSSSILEIGGGLGLVYAFLRKEGYNITSIEPSASSYDGRYETALRIFRILGVNPQGWYPIPVEKISSLKRKFDVIVSNNVLEHIQNLDSAFKSMKNVLRKGGVMWHNTVNYSIPYEPHFNMVLFPVFPKLTVLFKPELKDSSLWNGLNFITSAELKKICKKHNLEIHFQRNVLFESFERLGNDEEFAKRQRYFILIYKLLRKTQTLKLLKLVPPSIATPIQFSIRKNG